MTVRTRLVLTLIGIAVLLALPALYGASQLKKLSDIADNQRSGVAIAFLSLGNLQTAVAELGRFSRSYIAIGSEGGEAERAGINQSLANAREQLNVLQERGYPQAADAVEQRLAAIDQALRHVVRLMSSGRKDDATTYFEQVKPLLDEAQRATDAIAAAINRRSSADIDRAANISTAALTTTLVALIAALGLSIGIGYYATHSLITPLRRLRRGMATVAAGEFVEPEDLPYRREDEIGDLARSFSWMTQHLSRLDKMKAEFISIATHELKTPINVISGYTELVEEGIYGEITPDQHNALHAIRDQTQVLTRLVNQLLDISRLEAGGLQLEVTDVMIGDLMESLQRAFSVLAHKKNIDLKCSMDPSTPPTIQGDPDRLRDQVLGNLLSNALKFTPENGRIQVRTWGEEEALELEVKDSGVGIAKDQIPYVFDKFYQIGQQARSKGAGLGLAIAREVVEAHGGRIWVESTEGVGTTFRMSLPVEPKVVRGQREAEAAAD